MKLESLKLNRFKKNGLERDEMFSLKGGLADANAGTITAGGHCCEVDSYGRTWEFDCGYDAWRNGVVCYHNRTNRVRSNVDCTP